MPLAKLISDTAHAVVEALGLEQGDVVVEGLVTRRQRRTLVTGLWPVLRRYAACGQFLSVEVRSQTPNIKRQTSEIGDQFREKLYATAVAEACCCGLFLRAVPRSGLSFAHLTTAFSRMSSRLPIGNKGIGKLAGLGSKK